MANENEKNPSALEELRRLKRTDRIKSLDIHEPELHDFNAENIFHIDEEPEKKTIFGKRSARTHVKINENIFDDEVAESVDITPSTSIEEVEAPIEKHVVEEPKVDDKPLVEEEPKFVEEEPKKIVVEKLDVDDDFTTESIENELKSFNAKPIEEEQPVQEVLDDEEDFEDEYVDDDEGEDEDEKQGPKYIDDRLLETPVIAAGQVIKETIRMATKAKKGLVLSIDAFKTNDESLVQKVYENEKIINILEESITTYLVKLSKCELSDKEKNIVAATFHIVNDIERIGDHAENLADLTLQKINKSLEYSKDAIEELESIYSSTLEALDIAIESYESRDVSKARSIVEVEAQIDKKQKRFRDLHIKRLYDGRCNAYTGAIFLDILSNLERIGDHSTNIAESVIENN